MWFGVEKSIESGIYYWTYFKSLDRSLWYLTCIRSDIFYGVGLISKYLEVLDHSHLNDANRILCYIKGTINDGLIYSIYMTLDLCVLPIVIKIDIWMIWRAPSIMLFFVRNDVITWSSKKQPIVTLSTYRVYDSKFYHLSYYLVKQFVILEVSSRKYHKNFYR